MIKKDDDLIIVSKDFTNLRYGYFKSAEILLFYRILLAGKNLKKDNNVIIEDFSIVQKDLEIKAKDLKEEIFAIQDNFLRTKIKYADRNGVGTIALFEGIYNNIKDNTIEAILTSRGKEFLQNLSDGYIRFLFTDVLKFKSKYSRLILPHLMNVSHLKKFIISKEKLLEIFEIEEKDGYNNLSNFNRVVLKAVQTDLKDIFEDFEIEKKKEGRTIKSYIFKWSNDFNFKKDFEKEKVIIEAEAEAEETEVTKIFKILSEKIPSFKIRKNDNDLINALEKRLEQETVEEITSNIIKNWHRVIEKKDCKDQSALLRHSIIKGYEISNLTAKEIEQEKNILNGKGILHKEVKYVKPDWSNSDIEEAKKKDTVKEKVKEIENITYKEYLEVKEKKINLFNVDNNKDTINLSIQKTSFNNYLRLNYNVTLTKSEWEKEIKDLAQRFYSNNIKEATEVYKNFFIIKEEAKEEVKKEVVKEEKKIEIISYKEYLEKKEIELKKLEEKANLDPDYKELDIALRKFNFFNLFKKGKIQVNLTKKEAEQEIKNLKNYFKTTDEIIKQEIEMITLFVIIEEEVKEETKVAVADVKKEVTEVEAEEKEEEVKEETKVAVAEVVEKNNTTDEKAILNKVSKSLFENATEIKNNDKLSEKERKEKLLKMLKENIELLEKETDQFDEEDIASIFKK